MNGIDEKEMMVRVVYEVSQAVNLPLCIDSSNPAVIEAALRIYPGRALVNSVSLEKVKMQEILPLVRKYGAMFILLPLSDEGLPKDSDEKEVLYIQFWMLLIRWAFRKRMLWSMVWLQQSEQRKLLLSTA